MNRLLASGVVLLLFTGVFFAGVALGQQRYRTPKTVLHVVSGKWKPEATEEQKRRALQGVKNMAATIPGIKNIWLKADRVQPREFHTAFAIEFESRAAADAYADHPAHRDWEKIYLPIREQSRSLQITNP